MHEEVTDRLSEYLDDELEARERAAVEAHLRGCRECAAVLEDLRRVVARAQSLIPAPPQADLWSGIAARIDRIAQPRRFSFTLPQLVAAAALLIAVSGALVLELTRPRPERAGSTAAPVAADVPQPPALAVAPVSLADSQYDAAVADLEKAVRLGRGRLDAATIATVERNLQIIDEAIAQAGEALAADPANTYLSGHLIEARRRKLNLLRRAAALGETD
jgi:hypothetical protein